MKSTFIRLLPVALLSACLWFACKKDMLNTVPDRTVTASFVGRVIDEQDQPVAGATVTSETETRVTDANGVFVFRNIPVKEHHAFFKVAHGNYFTGGRLMSVTEGNTHAPVIQLLKKQFLYPNFSAAPGGTYNVPDNGPSLKFPANAFKDGANTYAGAVTIAAKYINPSSDAFADQIPGSLLGLRSDGTSEEVLASFGMVYVELRGNAGQTLEIAAGKRVEITMPIPAGLAASAPDEIPLWYFDEADGLWKEEGTAQKQGNTYVGQVSHFSTWNYDYGFSSVNISGKVVDQNGQPVAGASIVVTVTASGWNIVHGYTDMNGEFSGPIAKDEALTILFAASNCNAQADTYTASIGPFSADAVLPQIVMNLSTDNSINISADLLDCNNAIVSNGYLKVSSGNQGLKILLADASGHVQGNVTFCGPSQVELVAVNVDNLTQSLPYTYTIPPNMVAAGSLQACGQVAEHILFNLDGQDHTLLNVGGQTWQGYLYLSGSNAQNEYIQFDFQHNDQPGTYDFGGAFTVSSVQFVDTLASNINISTNLTQYGPNAGDPIIGTFSGDFLDGAGNTHVISGSYNTKHD